MPGQSPGAQCRPGSLEGMDDVPGRREIIAFDTFSEFRHVARVRCDKTFEQGQIALLVTKQ